MWWRWVVNQITSVADLLSPYASAVGFAAYCVTFHNGEDKRIKKKCFYEKHVETVVLTVLTLSVPACDICRFVPDSVSQRDCCHIVFFLLFFFPSDYAFLRSTLRPKCCTCQCISPVGAALYSIINVFIVLTDSLRVYLSRNRDSVSLHLKKVFISEGYSTITISRWQLQCNTSLYCHPQLRQLLFSLDLTKEASMCIRKKS